MKNLILAVFALLAVNEVMAAPAFSESKLRSLNVKLQEKAKRIDLAKARAKKLGEPLVNLVISPDSRPRQGESIVIFASPSTGFEENEVLLEGALNSIPMPLEHPTPDLWIFNGGIATEIRSHVFTATMYIQDRAIAQQTRDAIFSLEGEISSLNAQISQTADPVLRAQLAATRDAKIVLKEQLVATLASLKSPVGESSIRFDVVSQPNGTVYPRITDVTPRLVKRSGGSTLTIAGANFGESPQVLISGAAAVVTAASPNSLTISTPNFTTEGEKDIEVRFSSNGAIMNAIRKNAIFATDDEVQVPYIPPTAPVGIAQAVTSSVNLGAEAQFSASSSYDLNEQPLAYEWRLIAKPNGSALALNPSNPSGTSVTYGFSPDVPGQYVMELRISETTSPFMVGNVSLAVVEAIAPVNSAPTASAPSISVANNLTNTSQITAADADFWQSRSYFISKQGTLGTASVSSTGLVTYVAGSTAGSDEVQVLVIDNGNPPLSTTVTIPVTVIANLPPVIQSTPIGFIRTQGVPYQVRFALNGVASNGISDPDGTIVKAVYDFGDGTQERTLDLTFGGILHNYMQTGTYTVTLTATDNLGATFSVSSTMNVVDTDIPTVKLKESNFFGPIPLTVNYDASEAFDSDGIAQYRWAHSGTAIEDVTTSPFHSHTFNFTGAPGTIGTRVRFRDAYNAEGEATFSVFPGQTSAPFLPLIGQPKVVGNREVLVNTPLQFDGSRSFTLVNGQSITNYRWRFNDFLNCPSCLTDNITSSYTYTYARNRNVNLQVTQTNGALSNIFPIETWTVNAGHAPRSILRVNRTSGPAPLTINMDGSESYDYDGTLTYYSWAFGDSTGVNGPDTTTASHTYSTPGTYNIVLSVADSDGNTTDVSQLITVTGANRPVRKLTTEYDPVREYERQLLTSSCFEGAGDSCYQLGLVYEADGDTDTKNFLWEKACGLGYAAACQKVN